MLLQKGGVKPVFTMINGAGQAAPDYRLPLPPAPQFCKDELAAEMAQLFALALLQDLPLRELDDPHTEVPEAGGTCLHEVLCELRGLRWFDSEFEISPRGAATSSPALFGDQGRRRSRNWNRDGQLTLPILTRGPVALQSAERRTGARHLVAGPCEMPDWEAPKEGASMGDWQDWCCAARGVTDKGGETAPQTLREMAQRVAQMPAARPFYALTLDALAAGQPRDVGLEAPWRGTDILSLLALGETEALRLSIRRIQRDDRTMRPAVVSARLAARLSREDRAPGDTLAQTAQDLAYAAPRLLDWVHQANEAARSDRVLERNVFLPICTADEIPVHSADLAGHAIVAGTMATIIKAAFDTTPVNDAAQGGARLRAADLDQVCSDLALARCVAGTHFPAENHQDLRIGEALALRLLRSRLETQNQPACLGLTDFDGARLELRCRAGRFGRGMVTLYRAGQPVDWPLSAPAGSHLIAVS